MDTAPTMSRTDELKSQVKEVQPDDTMAEATRKALLPDFLDMLDHEAGSRTGDDIEDVHDMRVATRRMRSALQLLSDYFKPKTVREHTRSLRRIARSLGAVRDLDVLILDLQEFQKSLDDEGQAAFQSIIERLDGERSYARHHLIRLLDKNAYRRFTEDYAKFLTTPGSGARPADSDTPSQLRHLLPTLIYEHLGTVRAYDARIADADLNTLHALRIEFKRLRYLVSLFADVLGTSIKDFVKELKVIQDHLGRLNDLHVAQERLNAMREDLDAAEAEALGKYIDSLQVEEEKLRAQVDDIWRRFNSKTVQRQLATAIAAL